MPAQFEDTQAGATDISGQPDPVRSPKHLGDQQRKEQNQNERRPQPKPTKSDGGNPVGDMFSGLGSAVHGAEQGATNWLSQQSPQSAAKPLIDWGEEWNKAPDRVWGFARQAYAQLSGGYHDSVHNIFAGDDARSMLAQFGTSAIADLFVPGIEQEQTFRREDAKRRALLGQISPSQRMQEGKQEQEQAVQDAPGQALQDVTMPLTGPEGLLLQGAVPLAEEALGGNATDPASLAWMALGGTLLARSHLPPEVRTYLMDKFGEWPMVERLLGEAKAGLEGGNQAAMDPQKQDKAVVDHIQQQLDNGAAMQPTSRTIAKGVKPGDPTQVTAEIGQGGEVKLLIGEAAKKREALLKQLGVEGVEDLPAEAAVRRGFTGKQMKLISDGWKTLRMPYDLNAYRAGEAPLRDPRASLEAITDDETRAAATAHTTALNRVLGKINSGLWATSRNPAEMIMRSIAGQGRSGERAWGKYVDTLVAALEKWGVTEENGKLWGQAVEGSQTAYEQLPPEAKLVADGWGLVRSALRQQSEGTQYAEDFGVPNYAPRLDVVTEPKRPGPGRPNQAEALAKAAKKHRALAINLGPSGQLVKGLRYGTVGEANQAVKAARETLFNHLMDGETKLRKDLRDNDEAKAIRAMLGTDLAGASERARQMSIDMLNLKDENLLRSVVRSGGYQMKSLVTAKGLAELEKTYVKGAGGVSRPAAVAVQGSRHLDQLRNEGYVAIADDRFRGHMFDPALAKVINRYMRQSPDLGAPLEAAATVNRQLQRIIMYSPMIHGMNMGARTGALSMAHPLQMASLVAGHGVLNPRRADEDAEALRDVAYDYGLLTPRGAKNYIQNFSDKIDGAFADSGADLHMDEPTKTGRMMKALSAPLHGYQGLEDLFWHQVNDFGVTAFHVEFEAAKARGMDTATAGAWAARRANSWMGMVLPEDTSPLMQRISKLAFFAPNWWRTWAELTVPVYNRSGIFKDPKMTRYVAEQGARHIVAAYGFQHLTGNLMNVMLSGHLQSQNQDGNQDKVEITNPAILHALAKVDMLPQGVDPNTGVNPQTGAVMTMENPFGRQIYSLEQALGYQSRQAGRRVGPGLKAGPADLQFSLPGQASDVEDGMSRTLAGKISPLVDASAALMNIDFYQSINSHTLQGVVPGQQPGTVSPLSVVAAALMQLPGGLQAMQQSQRNIEQGGQDQSSLFGTQVPASIRDTLGQVPGWGSRFVFSSLLGTNPPYATANKTRGVPLSDADYQKVKQLQDAYTKQQQIADAEMLSGQMRPDQWRTKYLQASADHASQMKALFHNAPEYVNGADGLLTKWEAIYDDPRVARPDGTVDQGALAQLQAQFRSEHTAEQMKTLHTALRKNDTKYQGVKLYHHVLDAYDQWQANYAVQRGIDVVQLRTDVSGYNALYGDSASQAKFLQQHKELRAYQHAVTQEWDRSLDGMMYQFFHGQHIPLLRTLKAKHMTVQQLEQEVGAEPPVAAA